MKAWYTIVVLDYRDVPYFVAVYRHKLTNLQAAALGTLLTSKVTEGKIASYVITADSYVEPLSDEVIAVVCADEIEESVDEWYRQVLALEEGLYGRY